ncbi:hypothetical protein LINGRAHAP2_LOCUS32160, partial [Linum grandiflorum]
MFVAFSSSELLDQSPTFKLHFKPVKFEFPFPKPPFSSVFCPPSNLLVCALFFGSNHVYQEAKRIIEQKAP